MFIEVRKKLIDEFTARNEQQGLPVPNFRSLQVLYRIKMIGSSSYANQAASQLTDRRMNEVVVLSLGTITFEGVILKFVDIW
ncbi:hypothetical protein ACTXT7_014692 [Hymenolepis weldensis]